MKSLLHPFNENGRHRTLFLLAGLSLLCIILLTVRMVVSDSPIYRFLLWNLFLALIPYALSRLIGSKHAPSSKSLLAVLFFLWIIFLPNAPYLLTDLLHLRERPGIPLWYDMLMLLSFGWTGLIAGFISLLNVQVAISQRLPEKIARIISLATLFLCSFGIYLGRFLRLNSWDVITNPGNLLGCISDRLLNPFSHPRTWAVTCILTAFLMLSYLVLEQLMNSKKQNS